MLFNEEQTKELGDIISSVVAGLVPEQSAKAAEEAVAKAFEEKGIANMEAKLFGGAREIEGLEGKEKTARFIKALYHKDTDTLKAITKAMTGGTDANGGFLVPDEFRGEVIRMVEDFGLVRRLARVIPMKRDTLNLPKVTASVTVYWPGEATAGTQSQPTLAQIQLLAKTVVGLTPLSNELLEDADVDTISLLVELFAEALAGEEDKQGLVGTGSPFTGLLSDAAPTIVTMPATKTTFASIIAGDLRDLISNVKPMALSGAGFVMHRSVWGIVQKLTDTAGSLIVTTANPINVGNGANGIGVVGYIWGFPVYLSEKMPFTTAISTKFIVFGNLKYLYLGDRRTMTMDISGDAVIAGVSMFETNMKAVRVTERIAIKVGLGEAFSILRTAAA